MMELIKQWLLGITGAAILAALAEGIMPEGGIKQVGKLVCGLMLLAAVLKPVLGLDMAIFSEHMLDEIPETYHLQEETQTRIKQIIEDEFSAYSMDKAKQLGVECEIRIHCDREESGIFLPCQAEISDIIGSENMSMISDMLCTELGLPENGLLFEEGGQG